MDEMNDQLGALEALGLELPSPAYIFGSILFGILGFIAYRYGKKMEKKAVKWLGIALMVYPYVVYNPWMLYLVGIALCGAIYYFRDA